MRFFRSTSPHPWEITVPRYADSEGGLWKRVPGNKFVRVGRDPALAHQHGANSLVRHLLISDGAGNLRQAEDSTEDARRP